MKRKQRLRLEAGKQKAENVSGKIEKKLLVSIGKGNRRNGRRKRWEEIDEGIAKEEATEKGRREGKKRSNEDDEGFPDVWIDDVDDDEGGVKTVAVETQSGTESEGLGDVRLSIGDAEAELDEGIS